MSIVVLALDAADYRLLTEWECEHLLFENYAPIETFSHTQSQPHTLEVWPTVATGLHPREHGITPESGSETEWDFPVVQYMSHFGEKFVPKEVRTAIGAKLLDSGGSVEQKFPTVEASHPFDEVYMWPGLTPATDLGHAWELLDRSQAGKVSHRDFEHALFEITHREINWAAKAKGVVGVHCHVLDAAGHAYCRQPEKLRHYYERVNHLVGSLRTCVDDLVVLSDHGMQVSWKDDEESGKHSDYAMIATTLETALPETVFDVAEWLCGLTTEESTNPAEFDTTRGQLEDLGYL